MDEWPKLMEVSNIYVYTISPFCTCLFMHYMAYHNFRCAVVTLHSRSGTLAQEEHDIIPSSGGAGQPHPWDVRQCGCICPDIWRAGGRHSGGRRRWVQAD